MRFVLALVVALATTPVMAQQAKPAPSPTVLADFLRSAFAEMFGDLTELVPVGGSGGFTAKTRSADLQEFDVFVAEREPGESDLEREANAAYGSTARDTDCHPWRSRGEASGDVRMQAMTMLCLAGSEGFFVWAIVARNDTMTRTVMLSVPAAQSAIILDRSDRLVAALKMTPTFSPRSLAEAMAINYAHAGFVDLYDPAKATLTSPTSMTARVKDFPSSGEEGGIEVDAPSCGAVTIRSIKPGPTRTVSRETRIDLNAVKRLVTREGVKVRVAAGTIGRNTGYVPPREPIVYDEQTKAGLLDADDVSFGIFDSYLVAIDRFCAG